MDRQILERGGVLCCAVASCFIMMGAFPAKATFSTSGRLQASIQSPYTSVDQTENTGTENSDSEHFVGDYNNELEANYIVSLPQGRMDAYVRADGGDLPPGNIYYQWASGLIEANFVERIDFNVPAGAYPDGVTVHLNASLLGGLDVNGGEPGRLTADANFHFQFDLSSDSGSVHRDYGPIDSGDPLVDADESLVFDLVLLYPGANIAQETTLYGTINTSLNVIASFLSLQTTAGSATADLYLSVLSLEPSDPRVTWTSESGVFLVPEPSSTLMLGASTLVLLGLATLRRSRGFQGEG